MLLFSRVKLASPGLPGTEEMKAKPDQKWVQQNKCTGYNERAGVFEDSGSLLFLHEREAPKWTALYLPKLKL